MPSRRYHLVLEVRDDAGRVLEDVGLDPTTRRPERLRCRHVEECDTPGSAAAKYRYVLRQILMRYAAARVVHARPAPVDEETLGALLRLHG